MLGQTARDTVRFLAGSRCPNEATRLGHLGYKRAHWTGDHTIDRGRRARFPEASRTLSSTDPRQEEVAKSLEGNWRPELLFVLQQEIDMYDTYQRRVTECDEQLQKHLTNFTDPVSVRALKNKPKTKKAAAKNAPRFDLSSELERITGVDLTRIDGIDVMVSQTILSEVGLNMSRWKTEAHFASWLGLCPTTASAEIRSWAKARVVSSTVPLPHCDKPPTRWYAVAATSAPSTAVCVPG